MIFYWSAYNECYILKFENIIKYWDSTATVGRKSLPYKEFKENGFIVKEGYAPRLNYLKIVDEIYFKN